jgi:hypothetical protein
MGKMSLKFEDKMVQEEPKQAVVSHSYGLD